MGTFKIGTTEFAIMVTVYLIGTAAMLVPVPGVSEHGMWIASLIGWVTGIGYVLLLGYCKVPPGHHRLSRIILSLYALHLAVLVTRNLGTIMNLTVLMNTPMVVINGILVVLSVYVTKQGIEVVSRLCGFFVVVYTLAEVILIVLAVPTMKPEHIQPLFDQSFGLIIMDAIPFITFPFMEAVVFLPLLKLVDKPGKALLAGTLLGGGLLVAAFLAVLLILPPIRMQYFISPAFVAINSIPAGNFVKAVVIAVWTQTGFIKLAVLHYVTSKQLGDALNINYRSIVLPISVLIVSLSIMAFDNTIEMFNFAFKIYPYYAAPFQLGIPLLFLIAGWRARKV